MEREYFLSQRLGFSNAQAAKISSMAWSAFVQASLDSPKKTEMPDFLADSPKTRAEYRQLRKSGEVKKKLLLLQEVGHILSLGTWWLEKMYEDELPLREKMTLFWHNHFVSSFQKVKVSYALYQQNELFRLNAFGNFKTLTQLVLHDNAMLAYLDNTQNKVGALNENLSRELLELFTLGAGNYSETDIKEGARALAGLTIGDNGGEYVRRLEDNGQKTYLGQTGNWKADDLVRIIFEQPVVAQRITTKLLKFFMTDDPSAALIGEYADFLKKQNFEIRPTLEKLFNDQRFLMSQGQKIKNPMEFLLNTLYEFQLDIPAKRQVLQYAKEQGMELFNPPNVKGWDGGHAWLSSQKLLQRCNVVNILSSGKTLETFSLRKKELKATAEKSPNDPMMRDENTASEKRMRPEKLPNFRWDKNLRTHTDIIKSVTDKLIFQVSAEMQQDMEEIIRYDFNPQATDAHAAVLRLANYVLKSPEYQIC
jgi:uncharacterized protein (DUF1800 family)